MRTQDQITERAKKLARGAAGGIFEGGVLFEYLDAAHSATVVGRYGSPKRVALKPEPDPLPLDPEAILTRMADLLGNISLEKMHLQSSWIGRIRALAWMLEYEDFEKVDAHEENVVIELERLSNHFGITGAIR